MKITLIKPKIGHSESNTYKEKAVMEPLALAIIAALTPPDIETVLYDDRIEDIRYDEPTDLVAITVETFTARRAYEISAEYRIRGVPVIMGGYHPSHLPEEVKEYADSVFVGDAEDKWKEVIEDFREGQLKAFYYSNLGDLQKGIIPKREIFIGKKYLEITLMQFSRGCYYDCNFCTVSTFYKRNFFHRPVKDVVKEIEDQGRKLILFVDDNIVMDKNVAKELFRALIPLKIKWFSEADINMANDPELMDLMVKSGCIGHLVGFESINKDSLEAMKKTPNLSKYEDYRRQLEIIRDAGLLIWAAFTIGHRYDYKDTFERTYEFAMKHKFVLADFNVLMPYPGTKLYEQLKEEGRLLYDEKWWLHDDFRFGKSAYVPHNMKANELEEGCYSFRVKYYSVKSIVKRAFDFKTNMKSINNFKLYQLSNYLSYNDALKKQDIKLGQKAV